MDALMPRTFSYPAVATISLPTKDAAQDSEEQFSIDAMNLSSKKLSSTKTGEYQ